MRRMPFPGESGEQDKLEQSKHRYDVGEYQRESCSQDEKEALVGSYDSYFSYWDSRSV